MALVGHTTDDNDDNEFLTWYCGYTNFKTPDIRMHIIVHECYTPHRTILIIFALNLQAVTVTQMTSVGGESGQSGQ